MFKKELAKPLIGKQTYKLPTSKMRIKIKPLLMLKSMKIKMPIQTNFWVLLFTCIFNLNEYFKTSSHLRLHTPIPYSSDKKLGMQQLICKLIAELMDSKC